MRQKRLQSKIFSSLGGATVALMLLALLAACGGSATGTGTPSRHTSLSDDRRSPRSRLGSSRQ